MIREFHRGVYDKFECKYGIHFRRLEINRRDWTQKKALIIYSINEKLSTLTKPIRHSVTILHRAREIPAETGEKLNVTKTIPKAAEGKKRKKWNGQKKMSFFG